MHIQPIDPSWLNCTGAAAPSVRAVAATDHNAFAVGDVVRETGESIGGVAVVSLGYFGPQRARPFIVVAVVPTGPSLDGVSPVLPAGPKGANGQVWVIAAGNREFLIVGDGSTPARGEIPGPGEVKLTLHEQNLGEGSLFASLKYGPSTGSVSGTSLDG